MPPRSARRRGVLATVLLLATGLLAPSVASAAPSGAAAQFGSRGSALADDDSVRTSAATPIEMRDLSFACPTEDGRLPASGFTDVRAGSTFERAIDCLVWYGITKGRTATTYEPEAFVNRQQMAVFIHRMLADLIVLPDAPSTSRFADVPATGEFGEAINVLASPELAELLGVQIVTGKDSRTYAPGERVSRAQMGSFIARTLEGVFEATGVQITDRGRCDNVFSDESSIPSVHMANVKLLCAAGVVAGRTDGSYGPATDVNRQQMAAFLMRLMDILVEVEVTVPPDAVAEVHVDRGTAEAPCAPAGADGSLDAPFCTIQAGVDAAGQVAGHRVDVLVHRGTGDYLEDVDLRSGDAFEVNLLNAEEPEGELTDENAVFVRGTLTISGASASDLNSVVGIIALADTGPAIAVRTPGTAVIALSGAAGDTAIQVDQAGRTGVFGSLVQGYDVAVDLIDTHLTDDGTGTLIEGTSFFAGDAEDSPYVRAPGGASTVVDANLEAWRADNGFFDYYGDVEVATTLATVSGRRAIVPA